MHKNYRKKVLNMTMAEAIISGNLDEVKKFGNHSNILFERTK